MTILLSFYSFSSLEGKGLSHQLQQAQEKIRELADDGLSLISKESLSQEEKKDNFCLLLGSYFDIEGIAKFSLGRRSREATKEELQEYTGLFHKMIFNVYFDQFKELNVTELTITSAHKENDSTIRVKTIIKRRGSANDIGVDWLLTLQNEQKKLLIFDIIIDNVSLTIAQAREIRSILEQKGGLIQGVIEYLRTNFANAEKYCRLPQISR